MCLLKIKGATALVIINFPHIFVSGTALVAWNE